MHENSENKKVSDLVGRLSEVNHHWLIVGVVSLGVVPDDVTSEAMTFLVYQYIPTHTCVQVHMPYPHLLYR